ncbi:MAG TPA: ATP-binding protein [Anaerolineales bacterium]|nr:ATP-binding protein [Anaerolineales bacterium]
MNIQRRTSPLNFLVDAFQRREELSYRDLAEHLSDAFFLVTPRTGLFRYFNRRALELTGYSREELERLSLAELLAAPEAAEALNQIHKLDVSLNLYLQNIPLRGRSGRRVMADLHASATFGDGEVLVFILARDPEKNIILERAANAHTQTVHAMDELANLLASILRHPVEGATEKMLLACQRFTLADAIALYHRAGNFPGYQLAESVNLPTDFPPNIGNVDIAATAPLHWRAGERPVSVFARAARVAGFTLLHALPVAARFDTHAPAPSIVVIAYRSQQFLTIDTAALAATVANFVAAGQAITAHLAERAAQTQVGADMRHRFETLLGESAEGMVRVNAEGRIIEINRAAESLLGYHQTDTLNLPLEDVLISAQLVAQPILAALGQCVRWGGVETDLIRRDGVSVAVFIHAIPLGTGDHCNGGLILISDRTDQRHFQVQSDHLERRAWLGDLSAIFAHDVRNPLNGISTGLGYLASKFESDSSLADAINKMQAEVNRVDQLLKNVLLVAKSNELNFQPVPLPQLLDRILGRWGSRLARRNIQLETELDPRTPPARADVNQMDQVFTNLIVNAYDAMGDKGGTLSVKCHAATHPKTPRGEFVQILFGDTGPGIPPEMQAKIFDPFVTTKSEGTGLGLAITKRIVNGHKGSIFVESWPGIGTGFHVFIPVANRVMNAE